MPVVCISGCFDPLYQSDIEYIQMIRKLGYQLCVIVLNDNQMRIMNQQPTQSEDTRLRLIRSINNVDFAVLSCDKDTILTNKTIELIHPDIHVYSLIDMLSFSEREALIRHHDKLNIILENVKHNRIYNTKPIITPTESTDRKNARRRFSLFKTIS